MLYVFVSWFLSQSRQSFGERSEQRGSEQHLDFRNLQPEGSRSRGCVKQFQTVGQYSQTLHLLIFFSHRRVKMAVGVKDSVLVLVPLSTSFVLERVFT